MVRSKTIVELLRWSASCLVMELNCLRDWEEHNNGGLNSWYNPCFILEWNCLWDTHSVGTDQLGSARCWSLPSLRQLCSRSYTSTWSQHHKTRKYPMNLNANWVPIIKYCCHQIPCPSEVQWLYYNQPIDGFFFYSTSFLCELRMNWIGDIAKVPILEYYSKTFIMFLLLGLSK